MFSPHNNAIECTSDRFNSEAMKKGKESTGNSNTYSPPQDKSSMSSILLAENRRLKEELLSLDSLHHVDRKANGDLETVRNKLKKQASDHRKNVLALTSQLETVQKEKNELNRNFFNLSEDFKELQTELEKISGERDDAYRQLSHSNERLKIEHSSINEREKIMMVELEVAQSELKRLHYDHSQVIDQHHKYQERLGGMEEALALARSEVIESEEKNTNIQHELRTLKITIEEKRKKDEELQQKYNIMEKRSENFEALAEKLKGEASETMVIIQALQGETNQVKSERDEAMDACSNLESNIAAMKMADNVKNNQLEEELKILQEEKNHTRSKNEALHYEMGCLRNSHQCEFKEFAEKMARLESDNQQINEFKSGLQSQLEQREKELEARNSAFDSLSIETIRLKDEKQRKEDDLNHRIQVLTKEEDSNRKVLTSLKEKNYVLSQEKINFISEMNQLQKQIEKFHIETDKNNKKIKLQYEERLITLENEIKQSNSDKKRATDGVSHLQKIGIEQAEKFKAIEEDLVKKVKNHQTQLCHLESKLCEQIKDHKEKDIITEDTINVLKQNISSLEDDMKKQQNITKEKIAECNDLERQLLSGEKKQNEDNESHHHTISELQKQIEQYRKEIEQLTTTVLQLRECLAKQEKYNHSMKETNSQISKQHKECKQKNESLQESLLKLERDSFTRISSLQSEITTVNGQISEKSKEINNLEEKLKHQGSSYENESQIWNHRLTERCFLLEQKDGQLLEMKTALVQNKNTLSSQIDDLTIQLAMSKDSLEHERTFFRKDYDKIVVKLEESEANNLTIENKNKKLEKDLSQHNHTIYLLESEKNELKLRYEGKKRETTRLIEDLKQLNDDLVGLKNIKKKKKKKYNNLKFQLINDTSVKNNTSILKDTKNKISSLPRLIDTNNAPFTKDFLDQTTPITSTSKRECDKEWKDQTKIFTEKGNKKLIDELSGDENRTKDDSIDTFAETLNWPIHDSRNQHLQSDERNLINPFGRTDNIEYTNFSNCLQKKEDLSKTFPPLRGKKTRAKKLVNKDHK